MERYPMFLDWKTQYCYNGSTHTPQVIYRFNTVSQFQLRFSTESDRLILKFIWNYKGDQMAKTILF